MRDLVVSEALSAVAGDAALRLRELLASGAEIPYEVHEPGDGSPLAQYVPKTSRFIRDNANALRDLDSFGSACAALQSTGLVDPYLQSLGVTAPPDARASSELAAIVFLCRLWRGSTDLSLDDERLEATIEEVVALGEAAQGEIEIVVPLRGLQMEIERLDLAECSIVRADTVDVPAEARGGEGMGNAGFQHSFLAVARLHDEAAIDGDADLGIRAVAVFKRTVTTLRLFKTGGVSLGAHAWVRSGGDRWRRIATGSGRPRPGGYRLADSDLGQLSGFARALAEPTTPFARASEQREGFAAALARAISRFEAGMERTVVLEALNDYILALRFLLEGGGPASLGMPMRVAALCAEPDRRTDVKNTVDRALALERELWSGEPAPTSVPPAEVAAKVEDLLRAILKDAACGHLGNDLRTTADEVLLGDGMAVGEGSPANRGETAEWGGASSQAHPDELDEPADPGPEPEPIDPEPEPIHQEEIVIARAQNKLHDMPDATPVEQVSDERRDRETHWAPAVADGGLDEFDWDDEISVSDERELPSEREPVTQPESNVHAIRPDLEDGPVARLIADSDAHRRDVADRVSFLFPRPETTEWSVAEVGYDRKRRAKIDDPVPHAG